MTELTASSAAGDGMRPKTAGRRKSKALVIGIGVAAAIALFGIALWMYQLSTGLVVTNMRNFDSWGLYITCFMFFVGLSAGGLIISSAPRVFGLEGFGGISKIAVWTSICCTIVAVSFVIIDLGGPLRVWEMVVYSNLASPLMWDMVVLSSYLVLSVAYLWAMVRRESGKGSDRSLRIVSAISLVCAVLVHSVTAWIFGAYQSHEMWHTALLAPWFVSSALVCGTALVLVTVIVLRSSGYIELDRRHLSKMVKLLGTFVCVDLYFFACDLVTEAFPASSEVVPLLLSGPLAPFFWFEVVGCALVALVAFVPRFRTVPLMAAASLLAIAGIFCKRVQLLVGGFQIPNIDLPGPMTASTVTEWSSGMGAAYQGMVYVPSPIEFGIVLGVLGLGAFLLLAGIKYLPLKPVGRESEN